MVLYITHKVRLYIRRMFNPWRKYLTKHRIFGHLGYIVKFDAHGQTSGYIMYLELYIRFKFDAHAQSNTRIVKVRRVWTGWSRKLQIGKGFAATKRVAP